MPASTDTSALDPEREIATARLEMTSGGAFDAVRRLRELIARAPFNPIQNYWLAAALGAAGDWPGHRRTLKEAQTFHALKVIQASGGDLIRLQNDPAYATQVGQRFDEQDYVAVASVGYGRGAMAPDAPLWTTFVYGLALQRQGRIDEAVAAFVWVNQSNPGWAQAHGALLESLVYGEDGVRRCAEEARRWRKLYGDGHRLSARPFGNPPLGGRPLKVGYVAPGLDERTRQFLAPVLDHHDPDCVSATLYLGSHDPSVPVGADAVRVTGDLDDAAAAGLIRADGIDVLVDLCGHAVQGRLGVFVRRPAPVQVSWAGYGQTTGAPEVDYLIRADGVDVPGAQDDCVETIWGIGPAMRPFRPDPHPAPTPAPARTQGFVTFGSCSHPAQLSDQTLDAWARILGRVTGSRLVLRHRYYVDDVLQSGVLMRLAARGIDTDRIVFKGATQQPAYYQSFAEIDLALDTSPVSDWSASLDALANGVPVLTLAGPDHVSRLGAAAVGPLGLDELIAESWDDYVDRAVQLVCDVQALDALRRRVRVAFDRSAVRDEEGFTRRLEAAFAVMFDRWRERRSGLSAA